ncbi:protein FAM133-like isoform X1 [Macrosteles quadrilineatus]|uniref:protein FAM133-like isoform X1 n=1 Tax=Macrosteles quadrilineatus TaxID=74068 RepID=UPI0023E0B5EF|nr:protein FAM133-like isoform X1 [Macrosteles quadrilineatus]
MKEDKQKLHNQENPSDDDSSSSSEEDENAELLTEELEDGFYKVLSHLKKKGSKLYDEGIRFFPANSADEDKQNSDKGSSTPKKSLKEYRDWLRGQKEHVGNEQVKNDLDALHNFWTNPTLNKDEQFLRDYILNKKFLEPDDNFNLEEELKKLNDEEEEIEKEFLYEHKYNCRFENGEEDQPTKHKSKTKKKKKKGDISIEESDDTLKNQSHNDSVQDASNVEESTADSTNKKRKKKRKRSLENQSLEETEGVVEGEQHIKTEKNSKRIRLGEKNKNKVKTNEESPASEVITESLPEKSKRKLENVDNENTTVKSYQNIPRNLQMKNSKGKLKMRHRNRNKEQWVIKKSTSSSTKDGNLQTVDIKHKQNKVNKMSNGHKFVGDSNAKKFKSKENKHFQDLIVKEKKNKQKKLRKIRSKKQKAANVLSKR